MPAQKASMQAAQPLSKWLADEDRAQEVTAFSVASTSECQACLQDARRGAVAGKVKLSYDSHHPDFTSRWLLLMPAKPLHPYSTLFQIQAILLPALSCFCADGKLIRGKTAIAHCH